MSINVAVRDVTFQPAQEISLCDTCKMQKRNLCAAFKDMVQSEPGHSGKPAPLSSTVYTIPARRKICHPNEWYDIVSIICSGWAVSSITLQDGRRQILSLLLPGDFVSAVNLFQPVSGRVVEAVTQVTYRSFKRTELKAMFFKHPDLFERFSKMWIEERGHSEQLAIDLGRRNAEERLARFILSLMERLAARGMVQGSTMEFPMRQRQIADAMGLTPVHVNKTLSEFRRAGLIDLDGRSLTILDAKALHRIATMQ